MLIPNAQRVHETSIESFIIRVFRNGNRNGFIKAFSDDAENLTRGFNKVENILKRLYIKKIYLWPRFQAVVAQVLDRSTPDVIELTQSLTKHMKSIQNALLVAMNSCITELKKAVTNLDTSEFSLQSGLFDSFDTKIKSMLDPDWHKLSLKTKQLVNDIKNLRQLLDYLLRYDCFSFYSFLKSLSSASNIAISPSLW